MGTKIIFISLAFIQLSASACGPKEKTGAANAASVIDQVTQKIDRPGIKVGLAKNALTLEGDAANPFEADRAVAIAKEFIVSPEDGRAPATDGQPTKILDMMRIKGAK